MTFYKTRNFGGRERKPMYDTIQVNPGKRMSAHDELESGFHNPDLYVTIRRDGICLPEPLARQIGHPPVCTPDPQRHWLIRALSWLWASLEGRN